MNRLWIALGMLCLLVSSCRAASVASGTTQWNGRTVSYRATGDSATASFSAAADKCTLVVAVDGVSHSITLTPDQLEWNGKVARLTNFKQVRIRITAKTVRFEVDGKAVTPAAKKGR